MANAASIVGSAPENIKASRERVLLLGILCLTLMISYFDRVIVSVLAANDSFLLEMGIKGDSVRIGLMMSAFLAAYGLSNVLLSPVGDFLGPRKAMTISITLWFASMFTGAVGQVFYMIIASRIILGVGQGMHYPMQSVYVKKWFPVKERGRANAVWLIGQSLAPAAAMPLFAWAIAEYGWRSSFWGCAAAGLIPLYLIWRQTTDNPRQNKRVNALELQTIEAGLGAEGQSDGAARLPFWQSVGTFATNYRYWVLVMWYAAMTCIFWGLVSWVPSYLKEARHFSWAQMGWMSSLPFLCGILAKIISGWASDYVGRRAPFCFVGMLCAATGIYFGAVVENNVASAFLLAFAMGGNMMGTVAAWTLLQTIVPEKTVSTAAGLMNGISNGLSALAPVMIGLFIALTGGYFGGLLFMVGLTSIGIITSFILMVQKY